jgi:hypothetical protein
MLAQDFQALALIPGALDGWWIIGCEESGTIRDVFNAAGVRTISCDLKPSKTNGPHFQGDVRRIAKLHRWAGGIFHPDCTFLTLAGVRWLFDKGPSTPTCLKGPDRWKAMYEAAAFFNWLAELDIEKVCMENPIMHGYARALIRLPVTQYVQPYQHGHLETKKTGLHLKGLDPLAPTDDVEAAMRALPKSQTHKVHYASPGPLRAEQRSTFFPGIARAMLQWALPALPALPALEQAA